MDGKAIKVGIVGCGVCGSALRNWIEANNPNAEIRIPQRRLKVPRPLYN